MLASSYSENKIDQPEELQVLLPEELQQFFAESGYSPTTAVEARTNARLRVRQDGVVRFEKIPHLLKPMLGTLPRAARVLIKDLSRSGIGIIYHRQLLPKLMVEVEFQGRSLDVEIVRCRRLGERCYEIGGLVHRTCTLEE